jgi:hypothetical protein
MSADHTDNTIVNLKVLASLKSGERLSTRNNMFEISEASWYNSFSRRIQGDTRWSNLDSIKVLLEDATRILNTYLSYALPGSSGAGGESAYPSPTPELSMGFVRTMMTEMESAGRGLENLKETYTSDSRMLANLEVSLQKIRFETSRARHALSSQTAPQSQSSQLPVYIQQQQPSPQPQSPQQQADPEIPKTEQTTQRAQPPDTMIQIQLKTPLPLPQSLEPPPMIPPPAPQSSSPPQSAAPSGQTSNSQSGSKQQPQQPQRGPNQPRQ